jgi:hypothetical protein
MKKKSQKFQKIQDNQPENQNMKESLLINSLISFYQKDSKNIETLKIFLKHKQRRLSLRLLDWLVTNYAKKHNVVITNNNENIEFMYLAYKNHLKSYSKKFFDAFARRQRIFYSFDNKVHRVAFHEIESYVQREDGLITTIAQLNAFRFFITCGVIEYAMKHLDSIENDMVNGLNNAHTVNKTTSSSFITYDLQMTVSFSNT